MMKRWIVIVAVLLSGCATTGNPQDPLEPFNRGVYRFNDALDRAVLKPVAQGYDAVLPQPVQNGIANFFSNIDDVIVVVNDFLQLKIAQGVSDAGRLMINSTIGILGFIDVGSGIGLPKHDEDFGQTLGYWGLASGAYVVLPFFGPSTVRDTAGLAVDIVTDPVFWLEDEVIRTSLYAVRTISVREQLLDAEKVLDVAALDEYQFVRDAYLQRRRNLVYDGAPPKEEFDEGLDEDPAPAGEELKPEPKTQSFSEPRRAASRVWLPRIPKLAD